MSDLIVIGYDGTAEGADALALGRVLAADGRRRLLAACVAPLPHLTRDGPELRRRLVGEAEATLGAIGDGKLATRAVVSGSPAKGLFELAESDEADILVVGSSHHGGLGAVLAGRVGMALLQGAPCAVAVAPRGYRHTDADRLRVIGVGYDGSPQAEVALDGAIQMGLPGGATLRVMTVISPVLGPARTGGPGASPREPSLRDRMQDRLREAVARCPRELRALPQALTGTPVAQLCEEADKGVDLLVVGSRGYGPLQRVMLGSVAGELMRSAPCPVLVFPLREDREVQP